MRGFSSADGTLAVALFDNAAHFDARTNPIRKAYLTIEGGEAHWTVEALPTGDYALLAYHDENSNGELDFRPLGIPEGACRGLERRNASARAAALRQREVRAPARNDATDIAAELERGESRHAEQQSDDHRRRTRRACERACCSPRQASR